MKYTMVMMIVLASVGMLATAAEVEIVPFGPPPLLNGLEGDNEWLYPYVMLWGWNAVSVRLVQDSGYVYINVADMDTAHTGLDLYLDNMAGDIFMLHVSSAHGERRLGDSGWGEMTFGPPASWSSNLVESVFEDGKTKYVPPEVFEFQIKKNVLPSRTFKMMVHVKRPEILAPPQADTLSSADWFEVELFR